MAALRITNSLSPLRWSVGKPETAGEPLAQPQLCVPHGSSRTAGRSSPIFPRTRSCLKRKRCVLRHPEATARSRQVLGCGCSGLPGRSCLPAEPGRTSTPKARPQGRVPALARDILRYFSLVGVPSLAPAVAMAKAEAADRALRVLSSSRQDVMTTPLL